MKAKETAPIEFLEKVKARMDEENLGVTQLARVLGVSHPTVTDFVTYGYKPSVDTCIALAKWLNQSDVTTLREAGVLPPGPANKIDMDNWETLLSRAAPDDLDDVRQFLIMKIKRKEKESALKTLHPKKAG
ncbi:MAG: helix-turn-helix transcriptional regulator [Chloroflexi bacterium]|nr:helix-turn-helix transcriptional regulator [Chloroflexota bacterium]